AIYRTRFEPAAALLLEKARRDDAGALREVFDRYFVTDSARKAGLMLIDVYINDGDFAAAAEVGKQLRRNHPFLADDEPAVLLRTAAAMTLSGDAAGAKNFARDLQAFKDMKVNLAGREQPVLEALDSILANPRASISLVAPD